ncbi:MULTISPECIES: class I lanthipeptide [Flavobacterium]|jgi:hypothetical protein|uniref:Class I lanthipeptide n=1 Tax=Flavobacterium cupriresistens TaxID=2893885 RepID=A0ABU4RL77_9FLAO|nr:MULTISPECIES: class I lanthipeptide [unclassified Flavobacterium]MDX6192135.1 class I lanthipeptide [Flavobacterium sp. Fl-318]UFH43730.1 class I lanthipeptide [Flavobacterium sp. F-323]
MKNINLNNKLYFKRADVTELNDNSLIEINGGSTILGGETCSGCCCGQTSITVLQQM